MTARATTTEANGADSSAMQRASGLQITSASSARCHTSELADYYAMADVCVVPSLTESFGLVALEAQALGTPVVAAAVGGLREMVEDGVTGYLVEGHEPADYARAIADVLEDPDRRAEMGRRLAAAPVVSPGTARSIALPQSTTASASRASPAGSPCGYEDEEARALIGSAAS